MSQNFPNWVNWWEGNLGKMAKNCMEITKLAFLGQKSGGTQGVKPIFQVVGGSPQSPPARGNSVSMYEIKHQFILCTSYL